MFEILEKKSKRQRCSKVQIDGQLSIFDIQITEKIIWLLKKLKYM